MTKARVRKVPASARRDRAAVERARRDLARATDAVASRAAALVRVADRIRDAAVEAERQSLASELASDRLLRDVLELREALAAAPAGTLPPALEVLRKLPDGLLDWVQRRFGVQAHLRAGDELEVPAQRLSAYDVEGAPPPGSGLVRLRVLAPGWKRGGRVLVKPHATRI
jgi:hypothetical protein